ncbi:MAG: Plug domain-containing protein [Gemmatimonadales bacterium]|jgi:hypothetical protein
MRLTFARCTPLLALSSVLAAQTPASPAAVTHSFAQAGQHYRYRLLGVYDEASGAPIDSVQVQDMMSGVSSVTSSTGTVSLFFLPDGGSLVRMRKIGYEPQTMMVAIAPADTTPLTILLAKAPQQLATVMVKGKAPSYRSWRLQDAEDRVHSHAGGSFIDEAEMRKLDNGTLADALRSRMPGLLSVLGPHGETYFVSSRQPCSKAMGGCLHPDCFVRTYVDGIPSPGVADFDRMSSIDYAIAEFYPGPATVPIEYVEGNTNCGVLLLWTREF